MAENVGQKHQEQSESGTVSGKAGTTQFIIKVPKDQVYKIPPPENAKRFAEYNRRKANRVSLCCRCILWTLALVLTAAVLVIIAASVSYLIFRPQVPRYTIEKISVSGFDSNLNRSMSAQSIRLKFTIAVRAENLNEKVSVYYDRISLVTIRHLETDLCHGEMPYFEQPARNVTVLWTELRGAEIVSGGTIYDALVRDVKARRVQLVVNVEAPMRIGIGNAKSFKVRMVVTCEVAMDELTEAARIVDGGCGGSRTKICPLGPFVPAPPDVAMRLLREQGGPPPYEGVGRNGRPGPQGSGPLLLNPAFRQDPRRLRSYNDLDAPEDEVTVIDYRSL